MFDFNKETGEIFIYDIIGDSYFGGIDAGNVVAALSEISGQRATMRIKSPGGSCMEAQAIYNAMQRHPGGVDVVVDSLAASAGGYIAMGATGKLVMAKNSLMMVHGPMNIAFGNAQLMRDNADMLDKYGDVLAHAFADRSGKSKSEMIELFQGEHWYTAQEAVDEGFADEVGDIVVDTKPDVPQSMKTEAYKVALSKLEGKEPPKPEPGTRTPFNRQAAEARARRFSALKL